MIACPNADSACNRLLADRGSSKHRRPRRTYFRSEAYPVSVSATAAGSACKARHWTEQLYHYLYQDRQPAAALTAQASMWNQSAGTAGAIALRASVHAACMQAGEHIRTWSMTRLAATGGKLSRCDQTPALHSSVHISCHKARLPRCGQRHAFTPKQAASRVQADLPEAEAASRHA